MIRGLVFDFDGLMVETESPAFESWREIYREHGCDLPLPRWAAAVGGSGREFDPCAYLAELLGHPLDSPALRARRWQRKLDLTAGQALLPGVAAYIEAAGELGLKLGVASSGSREWVVGHLTRLEVCARFDAIICAGDVARVKPDPELYRAALAALDLRPAEAIAFEDSPNGLLSARRAGLFCVAVPNPLTGRLPLDHADLLLTSLADVALPALLNTVEDLLHRHDVGERAGGAGPRADAGDPQARG